MAIVVFGFDAGLFTSIALYRIFFHRLNSFPGPFGVELTCFWSVSSAAKDVKYFKEIAGMNDKYSDFIRTGRLPLLQSRGYLGTYA